MKLWIAAALAASMAVPALAEDKPMKLSGSYYVQGTNPNGSTYSGTAVITATSDNTCRIEWSVGSSSSGICMRYGLAFAASYVLGDYVGLVIYEIRADGTLNGVWTVADQPGVGTEVLTPGK